MKTTEQPQIAETNVYALYTQFAETLEARKQSADVIAAEWKEKAVDAKLEVELLEAEYVAIQTQIAAAAQAVVTSSDTSVFHQLKARKRDLPMLISAAKIRLYEIQVIVENSTYLPYQEILKYVRSGHAATDASEKAIDAAKTRYRIAVESVNSKISWHLERRRQAENKLYLEREHFNNLG